MSEWIDRRSRLWAVVAVVAGLALILGLELAEEPDMTPLQLLFEVLKTIPLVLTSVGVVLLFLASRRQREETLTLVRDLEVAAHHVGA